MKLSILTPDGEFLDTETVSVIVPGVSGLLGILKDHAPLLSAIKSGSIEYKTLDGLKKEIKTGAGLVEVKENQIIVLADNAEAII